MLKKSPKRNQIVWFTAEEDVRLQRFVIEDLKSEVAMNTVCAEIVNMVLEDDSLRKQLVGRIDGKVKQSWVHPIKDEPTRFLKTILRCPFCEGNPPSTEFHIKSMHKSLYKAWKEGQSAPLVVEVRSRN